MMKRAWIIVPGIAAVLVLVGGPAFLAGPSTTGGPAPPPVLRVVPFNIQVDQPADDAPFAPEVVRALRTALFVASAGPDDEVGADPAALAAPHLVLHVRPGRREGYRIEATVMRQPFGTLRPDTLVKCGRGNAVGASALEQGAAAGAYIAGYVECFRRFADSSARATRPG